MCVYVCVCVSVCVVWMMCGWCIHLPSHALVSVCGTVSAHDTGEAGHPACGSFHLIGCLVMFVRADWWMGLLNFLYVCVPPRHLEYNQISVVERGAFQDLKQLERL